MHNISKSYSIESGESVAPNRGLVLGDLTGEPCANTEGILGGRTFGTVGGGPNRGVAGGRLIIIGGARGVSCSVTTAARFPAWETSRRDEGFFRGDFANGCWSSIIAIGRNLVAEGPLISDDEYR